MLHFQSYVVTCEKYVIDEDILKKKVHLFVVSKCKIEVVSYLNLFNDLVIPSSHMFFIPKFSVVLLIQCLNVKKNNSKIFQCLLKPFHVVYIS